MLVALRRANIVVLASTHNPTIPSRDWLIQKQIFEKDDFADFQKKFAHTPVFMACETDRFSLAVDERRLQLTAKNIEEDTLQLLPEKIKFYVNALPETPYKGVGLNFVFDADFASSEERDQTLFKLFIGSENKTPTLWKDKSFSVGGILIADNEDNRMRLMVEPNAKEDLKVTLNFNFHFTTEGTEKVLPALTEFNQYLQQARTVAETLFET